MEEKYGMTYNEIQEARNQISRAKFQEKRAKELIRYIDKKKKKIAANKYRQKLEKTKRKVIVNGEVIDSIYQAAKLIHSVFPDKNFQTIRKAVRDIISGKNKPYIIYGTFKVEPA